MLRSCSLLVCFLDMHIGHQVDFWKTNDIYDVATDYQSSDYFRLMPYAQKALEHKVQETVDRLDRYLVGNNYIPCENNEVYKYIYLPFKVLVLVTSSLVNLSFVLLLDTTLLC